MKQLSQTWDLDVFFPGGSESKEFAAYLDVLKQDIHQLQQLIQQTRVPQSAEEAESLNRTIYLVQNIESRLREAMSFTECLTAQNVKDDKAKLLYGKVVQLHSSYSSVMIDFDILILRIPQPVWERFLSTEAVQPIAFPLNERRQRAAEKLSPELEVLANDLAVDGYHAWSDLYSKVVGRITIPVEKDGEPKELSVGQAWNMLSHEDRSVRMSVFNKWTEEWAKSAELCAHALNHLAGYRLNLYRHRGWESVLKEPLDINRMSEQTLKAMWNVIEQNKDTLVEYLNRKAKLLGLEKLSWYDVQAPIGDVTRKISYEEGAAIIVEQFSRLAPRMADFSRRAFEERWIEAEDRPNKRPGGFCTSFTDSKQTRIFMTYAGTSDNVSTLAHELGHAFHQHVMDDLPQMVQNYAMNVAETASTFAEMVVADAAVKNAKTDQERLVLLEEKAQSCATFLMNIYARFLFETAFYERRREGLVSVEELTQLMVEAQKRAFGDALGEYDPYFWASKLHFYITDVPFYNFPYTFGYLFSYGVYARALQEGPSFEEKYVALLRDTGRMTVEDLAQKHLDVDLTRPDFWQSAVNLALEDVKEFLRLTR
ncbi:M3 family oligoendopeptidase [Effusibacillus lacus]|uniref:Oligoendopeptidase n=1 Tax=Effusibacillus lacus TaxID=1348429 RepID=A0A292YJA1_9BACL|nr:M3 family oligoendopeptidase [Effusibacillus lacus]TCS72839.1 pepF/M3 family oligoendopeptidase [Effusibacillus lacus]GAX89236.1 oligoendopeptidase [Effusibacillus lacus]